MGCTLPSKVAMMTYPIKMSDLSGFAISCVCCGHDDPNSGDLERISVILGTEDGEIIKIRDWFTDEKQVISLPGGSILHIALTGKHDVVVADNEGNISILANWQIVYRTHLDTSITILSCIEKSSGTVVAGDGFGSVLCFRSYHHLWRCNISELVNLRGDSDDGIRDHLYSSTCARFDVDDISGVLSTYTVVDDSINQLLFLDSEGCAVYRLQMPALPTALCIGRATSTNTQLICACNNGSIYLIEKNKSLNESEFEASHDIPYFQLSELWTETGIPRLMSCVHTDNPLDVFICVGEFSGITAYQSGKMIWEKQLEDWIVSFAAGQHEKHGRYIVALLADQSILMLPFLY